MRKRETDKYELLPPSSLESSPSKSSVDTGDFDDDHDSSFDSSDDGGSSSYLSVSLFLMKGPHDDELTWSLRGEFDVKLLNQVSDGGHHSETVYFDDDTTSEAVYRVMDDD